MSTDNGATFTNIVGATSTTLTFTPAATDNANQYRVVFANSLGTATSVAATLSVPRLVTVNPSDTTITLGNSAQGCRWQADSTGCLGDIN